MFVWWSSGNNGPKIGCCGGLIFLPFAFLTMFGGFGFGGDGFTLMLFALVALAALFFILPRMMGAPVMGDEKRKNDAYDDYVEYEKPKRDGERYILTDDGEILDVTDEEDANSQRRDSSLF